MMRIFNSFILVLGVFFLGCASTQSTSRVQTGQTEQAFQTTIPVGYDYLLYIPDNYADQEAWPLMLFLHGAGERGDDLALVKTHGPPKLVQERGDFPFIVVSPQAPENTGWDARILLALVDEIVARYAVDETRIYVTGLSMGGYGTWALGMADPNRFAALVPICGGGQSRRAGRLAQVPIWAFHGAKDQVVPIEESEKMLDAIRAAGGTPKFTVYPEAGHDSWTATYDNPELYEWLLAQRKK